MTILYIKNHAMYEHHQIYTTEVVKTCMHIVICIVCRTSRVVHTQTPEDVCVHLTKCFNSAAIIPVVTPTVG